MFHAVMRRRHVALLATGLVAGCAAGPPSPMATLPPNPANPLADPARQAILHTAYVFASPDRLAGRTAEAAQAVAEVEFLTVELAYNQRWTEMQPIAQMAFVEARPEWRAALGIDPGTAPQAVIDTMTRLRLGEAAAAQPGAPGSGPVLARLSALPPLPRTARAAALVQQELMRMDRNGTTDHWE